MGKKKTGLVYLFAGNGKGKTTAALGIVLRCVAHGQKAVMIQFMKTRRDIGEVKIQKKLGKNYKVHQFGGKEGKGLEKAKKVLIQKPRVLILDEINLAVTRRLLKLKDVLELLEKIPPVTTVVLTGRNAPKRLIARADLVTEMKEIKHPFHKGIPAQKGIEY